MQTDSNATFKVYPSQAYFFGSTNLLCIDGETSRIGVRTNNPQASFDINGSLNIDNGPVTMNGVDIFINGKLTADAFGSNSIPLSALDNGGMGGSVTTFSNNSIPISAMQDVSATETFQAFIDETLSNIDLTVSLSNSIAQLTNITPSNIGAASTSSFAGLSNAYVATSNVLYGLSNSVASRASTYATTASLASLSNALVSSSTTYASLASFQAESNIVSGLSNSLNTISGTVSSHTTSFASLSNIVSTTSASLTSLSNTVLSLTSLSNAVMTTNSSFAGLSNTYATLSNFQGESNVVSGLSNALSTITGTVSTTSASLTSLSNTVTSHTSSLTNLSNSITITNSSFVSLSNTVVTAATTNSNTYASLVSFQAESNIVSGLSNALSTISGTVSSTTASLASLSNTVSSQTSSLTSLSNTITITNSSFASLSNSVATAATTNSNTYASLASFQGESNVVSGLSNAVSTISGTVSSTTASLASLSNTVSSQTSSLTSLSNTITITNSSFTSLSNSVATATATNSNTYASLANFQAESNIVSGLSNALNTISGTVSTTSASLTSLSNAVSLQTSSLTSSLTSLSNTITITNSSFASLSNTVATATATNSTTYASLANFEGESNAVASALINISLSNFLMESSLTWSLLSNVVNYDNLGSIPLSSFSNNTIPITAIQNIETNETFQSFINEALSNINVTKTLSNSIVAIAQELVSNTTYSLLGQVPLSQLSNVTPENIGAATQTAYIASSNAILGMSNNLVLTSSAVDSLSNAVSFTSASLATLSNSLVAASASNAGTYASLSSFQAESNIVSGLSNAVVSQGSILYTVSNAASLTSASLATLSNSLYTVSNAASLTSASLATLSNSLVAASASNAGTYASLSSFQAESNIVSGLSNAVVSQGSILYTVSNAASLTSASLATLSNSLYTVSNAASLSSASLATLSNSLYTVSNAASLTSASLATLSNSLVAASASNAGTYASLSSFQAESNIVSGLSNAVASQGSILYTVSNAASLTSASLISLSNAYISTSNALYSVSNALASGTGTGSISSLSNAYTDTSNVLFTVSNTVASHTTSIAALPTTYATLTNFNATSNILFTVSNTVGSIPATYATLTNFNNTSNILVTVSNTVASHTTSIAALPTTYTTLTNFNNTSNIIVTMSNTVSTTSSSLVTLSNFTNLIPTANPIRSYPPGPLTGNTSTLTNYSYGNGTYVVSGNDAVYLQYYYAFDSNITTRWQSANFTYSGTTLEYTGSGFTTDVNNKIYSGTYIQLQLPNPIYLSSFDYSSVFAVPSKMFLLGSTNGTSWNLIMATTIGLCVREKTNFPINPPQPTSYQYYRLVINVLGKKNVAYTECVELVLNGSEDPGPSLNADMTISCSDITVDGNVTTSTKEKFLIKDVGSNNFNLYPYITSGSIVASKDSPYWSSFSDGSLAFSSNNYLKIPANQFNTPWWQNGGFTVEYWLKTSSALSNSYVGALDDSGSNNNNWSFGINSNGYPTFRFALSNSTSNITYTSTSSTGIVANSWNHLAACFNTTTSNVTMFLNGVPQSNIAQSNYFPLSNNIPAISTLSNFAMYGTSTCSIANTRLVYGVPIYTAAFSTPTSPLYPNATGSNALVMRTPYVNKSYMATSTIQATAPQAYPPILNFANNTTVMSNAPYGNGTYVANASSTFGTYQPYFPFQNLDYSNDGSWSRWISGTGTYSNNGSYLGSVNTTDKLGNVYKGEWLQIKLPTAIYASSYSLVLSQNSKAFSWTVLGSMDGVTFECVDIQTSVNTSQTNFNEYGSSTTPSNNNSYISNTFNINPTSAYSYFRIVVHNVNVPNGTSPNISTCSLGTLQFFGTPPTMSISPDGLIGLGVLNPSKQLDVGGDAGVSGTMTSSNAMIQNQMTVIGSITFSNNPSIGSPALGTTGTGDCFILQSASNATTYPYSVGLCNLTLWTSVPVGAQHSWYVGGSNLLGLNSSSFTVKNNTSVTGTITATGDITAGSTSLITTGTSLAATSNILFTVSNTVGSIPATYATLTNFNNTSNILYTVSNTVGSIPATYATLTNFNNTSNILVTVSNVVASHTTSLAALPTTYATLTNFNNTSNILFTVSNTVGSIPATYATLTNFNNTSNILVTVSNVVASHTTSLNALPTAFTSSNVTVSSLLTSSNVFISNQLLVNGLITFSNNPSLGTPAIGTTGTGDCFIFQAATSGSTFPYSMGLCNSTLWTNVPVGAQHSWYVGGSNFMSLNSTGFTSSNAFIQNQLLVDNIITFSNNANIGVPALGATGTGDCLVYQAATGPTTYPYSVGMCNATLWTNVPVGAQHSWYVGGANVMAINSTTLTIKANTSVTGTITATGDITAFSDSRLKTDLRIIDNAMDKVDALHGYTYIRSDQADQGSNARRYAGVVAQEVFSVIPELVNVDPDSGLMSVAYGNISALLIQSIKELNKKVSEIELLNKRVSDLELRLNM